MSIDVVNESFLYNNYISLFEKSKIKCSYEGYNKVFKRYNYKIVIVFEGRQYTFNFYKGDERGPSHYDIIDYLINIALRMSKIPTVEAYIKESQNNLNVSNRNFEYNEMIFKMYHKDYLNSVRLFGEFKILNYKKCIDFIYTGYNYLKVEKIIKPYKEILVSHNVAPILVKCGHCQDEYYTSVHNRDAFCSTCISEFRR